MTHSRPLIDFSQLSVAERLLLAQQLWDSIHDQAGSLPFTQPQKQEWDRRRKAVASGKMPAPSQSEVKQLLLSDDPRNHPR
jgi:putative addiction module component (TIGR02574 family)